MLNFLKRKEDKLLNNKDIKKTVDTIYATYLKNKTNRHIVYFYINSFPFDTVVKVANFMLTNKRGFFKTKEYPLYILEQLFTVIFNNTIKEMTFKERIDTIITESVKLKDTITKLKEEYKASLECEKSTAILYFKELGKLEKEANDNCHNVSVVLTQIFIYIYETISNGELNHSHKELFCTILEKITQNYLNSINVAVKFNVTRAYNFIYNHLNH